MSLIRDENGKVKSIFAKSALILFGISGFTFGAYQAAVARQATNMPNMQRPSIIDTHMPQSSYFLRNEFGRHGYNNMQMPMNNMQIPMNNMQMPMNNMHMKMNHSMNR